MIFLTVGTQLPFDRLVAAVDELGGEIREPIVGQIGETQYVPRHIEWRPSVTPQEFDCYVAQARLVIAHAGTGTVLAAKRHRKPIILVPRRSRLGEHRNDHQFATCQQFERMEGVYVAYEVGEILSLAKRNDLRPVLAGEDSPEREALVNGLRQYLSKG